MVTAKNVADYIITRCINQKTYINNQQLQNILYQIHQKDNSLFDGTFQKVDWGYYEPNVFYEYICYGSMPITTKLKEQNIILMNTESMNQIINNYVRKE